MGAGRDCKLLFITDSLSGRRLLVDSGAQRSILPAKPVDTMAGGHGPPMDAAMYFHVVAALDASTTARAMALLEAPPATGKYDALKTFLLNLFELSELE
ncbi:hypothetical protein D4A39_16560 [Alcanivorax profundi]|uniref:Peptidase A2 domain-containing protein n=1 Tax=Alcanivorax profundi TaxID=2338368 RepID=A0A418XST3_9GAMM|nr:hypothetical protein D4A39_16560 [Alcanivorax profundi]